jgi:hypothetical protein
MWDEAKLAEYLLNLEQLRKLNYPIVADHFDLLEKELKERLLEFINIIRFKHGLPRSAG